MKIHKFLIIFSCFAFELPHIVHAEEDAMASRTIPSVDNFSEEKWNKLPVKGQVIYHLVKLITVSEKGTREIDIETDASFNFLAMQQIEEAVPMLLELVDIKRGFNRFELSESSYSSFYPAADALVTFVTIDRHFYGSKFTEKNVDILIRKLSEEKLSEVALTNINEILYFLGYPVSSKELISKVAALRDSFEKEANRLDLVASQIQQLPRVEEIEKSKAPTGERNLEKCLALILDNDKRIKPDSNPETVLYIQELSRTRCSYAALTLSKLLDVRNNDVKLEDNAYPAVQGLIDIGKPSLPVLIDALCEDQSSPLSRKNAIKALLAITGSKDEGINYLNSAATDKQLRAKKLENVIEYGMKLQRN